MVKFVPGAVSWYITSQAAENPGLIIRYKDKSGKWVEIVNTNVYSTDLSNKSFGDFIAPVKGDYQFIFTNVIYLERDTAAIINDNLDNVTVTYQFAGEDGTDGDFNDIYASVTWLKRKGW